MAGFARHALVLGSPLASAPSYRSYTSYMSYRVAIWYVGAGAAWKFGQRPRPSRVYARSCISCISCISCWGVLLARPQGVPPVQGQLEVWKLGCLEVWLSVHPFHPSPRRGVLFSVLCSPFSGARQRPLSFVSLRVSPAGQTLHTFPAAPPVARLPRALFSVFCSLFSVSGRRAPRTLNIFLAYWRTLCYLLHPQWKPSQVSVTHLFTRKQGP